MWKRASELNKRIMMGKKVKKPTIYVKTPKKATAIVGYSKKELPGIVKKTVKRNLNG